MTTANEVNDCIIEVKGLNKRFGDNEVLRDVDLTIRPGAITAIIGKSGAGKSVLLKCIAGLMSPDSGSIEVHCGRRRECGRPRLSYMFQNNALFDSMTAFDNVALPLRERTRARPKEVRKRVLELFQRLDLGDVSDVYPADLSGGMQKRVALARSLVLDPEVVLFDEPTTGLDPERKNTVFTMIERYHREFGYTAVMVSHDVPDVLYFSNYVASLHDRRIAFSGTPLEFEQSATEFSEGFLHGRDDLRDELSGLANAKELQQALPGLKEENRRLAVFSIEPYQEVETILGKLAAHLIESNLIRCLRKKANLGKIGFSLGRGGFALCCPPDFDPAGHLGGAMDAFAAFLHGLNSNRCVSFEIRGFVCSGGDAASTEEILRRLSQKGVTLYQHRCS